MYKRVQTNVNKHYFDVKFQELTTSCALNHKLSLIGLLQLIK